MPIEHPLGHEFEPNPKYNECHAWIKHGDIGCHRYCGRSEAEHRAKEPKPVLPLVMNVEEFDAWVLKAAEAIKVAGLLPWHQGRKESDETDLRDLRKILAAEALPLFIRVKQLEEERTRLREILKKGDAAIRAVLDEDVEAGVSYELLNDFREAWNNSQS